jgi:hypothetical protein
MRHTCASLLLPQGAAITYVAESRTAAVAVDVRVGLRHAPRFGARSQVRVDHKARVFHQISFQLATSAAASTKYSRERLNPLTHLLLDHDPKDVLVAGQIRTMVKMHGVSGGAVIHCSPSGVCALVGVVIEQRRRSRLIVATRMGPIVAFARQIASASDPAIFY